MVIVKFVLLMSEVAETHIYQWAFLQISMQYYVSLPNNYL